ncbi:hypothetical protein [Microcoleus sp. bin38.metabat.b11b12b14.051]|uniref:hypothetical protein n=1 Tax=Microcoleus sp. bin38.metabat.b11b12b14.051 TaxID=2742709 RepID=UPI0025D480F1|nr:hypothetical protein [Microcoleus sp. bin38.metabat.b11b12b14.051]
MEKSLPDIATPNPVMPALGYDGIEKNYGVAISGMKRSLKAQSTLRLIIVFPNAVDRSHSQTVDRLK